MKLVIVAFTVLIGLAGAAFAGWRPARAADPKDTILGTALSPAHTPGPAPDDVAAFFDEAARIGSHVTWICEWESMPPIALIRQVQSATVAHGLKFHFYISPILLGPGRDKPAVPKNVGPNTFKDPAVRRAYKEEVLTLASLRPDYLGLATEVNFLAQNPDEFDAFVTLARETYQAVKQKYPSQAVDISFQWEVMRSHDQFSLLQKFADSLDVYAFTTYPDAFGTPVKIPDDYYSPVRRYLPTQRVAISEIGWSSAPPSSEDEQAAFYGRIPALMRAVRPEYITLALLHDVRVFQGDLARLNAVGIRTFDDAPKKSWPIVLGLPEIK